MTPSSYETLIDQLIDEQVNMDELCSLVAAEKDKREKKRKAAEQTQLLNATRDDFINALICYMEELIKDEELWDWLESDEGFNQIKKALMEMEENLIQTEKLVKNSKMWKDLLAKPVVTTKSTKEEVDALRKWLNSRK